MDALGRLGGPKVPGPLLTMLRDGNADVRRHTIGALARIRDPASVDSLGLALRDKDWNHRMGAALVLMAIGDKKSIELLKSATLDENNYVRKIAETAVKRAAASGHI